MDIRKILSTSNNTNNGGIDDELSKMCGGVHA
jgi:hypothetical protein